MNKQATNDKMLKPTKAYLRPAGMIFPPYVAPIAFPTYEQKLIKVLYLRVSTAFHPNFAANIGVV
jgi:hypothetical protein